jgi:hypothetical protein
LNFNLPTGRTILKGSDANARMDPDFVDLSTFGEGFNIGPTLGTNLILSDTTTIGLGIGYTHRGPYDREGSVDPVTGIQGTQRLTPGQVATANASFTYAANPLTLMLTGSYTYETPTYLDGAPSFRIGGRYLLYGFTSMAWSDTSTGSISGSWTHSNRNFILDPNVVNLSGEAFNSNSDYYRAQWNHTFVQDKWSFGPTASWMKRTQNSFSPLTYQFVPPKTKITAGGTAKYTNSDNWSLSGRAEYFWAHEIEQPDKLLGGVLIPGSGTPEMHHYGWQASIGGTYSF